MKCDQCGDKIVKGKAVYLTQVVGGEVKKLCVCGGCADTMGVETDVPDSVADLLLGSDAAPLPTPTGLRCPECNMNRSDFKKTGRLGCAVCYDAFGEELEGIVKAMHHSDQHLGKVPTSEGLRAVAVREIGLLRQKLDHAILHEEYESAASIRDEIRAYEEGLLPETKTEES